MKTKVSLLVFALFILICSCGKEPVFKTEAGSFQDPRDNHSYSWTKIGTQYWMAENLAWLPAVSPSSVASETEPNYYVYGFEGSLVSAAMATANYQLRGTVQLGGFLNCLPGRLASADRCRMDHHDGLLRGNTRQETEDNL